MRGLCRGAVVCVFALSALGLAGAASALGSPETPTYLGTQQRFTIDAQTLADRASIGVNVANGNLLVSAADVRIAGRGLSLSLART